MKTTLTAGIVCLAITSGAQAQQAVQWKVEDGGNGHWYRGFTDRVPWSVAFERSMSVGGHLATCTSSTENQHVRVVRDSQCAFGGAWIGLLSPSLPGEPAGDWGWVTGEPLEWTNWMVGEPNGFDTQGAVARVVDLCCFGESWGDADGDGFLPYVVEWSADCNSDGIVDYGQCLDGSLPDYNGNSIPDSCEVPAGWVVVADSVADYTTTQGANGWHYLYDTGVGTSVVPMAYVVPSGFPPFMPAWCTHPEFGGNGSYCSIDQIQCHTSTPSHCSSASAGLERPRRRWISPGAVKGRVLISGYFGATAGFTTRLQVFADGQLVFEQAASPAATPDNLTPIGAVVDLPPTSVVDVVIDPNDGSCHADRVEYSIRVIGVDCNSDGAVDYGQILEGQLVDANNDGIPDVCQLPTCADADLFRDFNVNGADLGILLSQWGPITPLTESDLNGDGVVDGADLGLLLSFWGGCP
jgi:hypothetical protein